MNFVIIAAIILDVCICAKYRTRNFLIAPIIHMQLMLRENLIGKSFWIKLENKRHAREEFSSLERLLDMQTEVQEIQIKQKSYIRGREKREKEKDTQERITQEKVKREELAKLHQQVASGARKARSSIVQLVHGGKKGGKNESKKRRQVEDEFNDIGSGSSLNMSICQFVNLSICSLILL